MRIGVNCFLLSPKMGGLRQYFHRLFRWLLRNDPHNSYLFFYFPQNLQELQHYLDNPYENLKTLLLNDQMEIVQHLDKMDLYFCPFGALWPCPMPLPSVVTLVDAQEKYYPQFFSRTDIWNRQKYYDISMKTADQVITISEFSKKSIALFHPVKEKNIHVAYLAMDDSFAISPDTPDTPDTLLDLPPDFIFYPANRWAHKNHDTLLKAIVILKEIYFLKVHCVLTGFDIDQGYPLQENIVSYGVSEQVRTIGYVSRKDLQQLYRRARMLCFPSLFEGFGMPLVEAMASGCPVVCANVTSIPEVTGNAALLFDPMDAHDMAAKIHELWRNEPLRQILVERGHQRAKLFSIEHTARTHIAVFEMANESFKKSHYYLSKFLYVPWHNLKMEIKR